MATTLTRDRATGKLYLNGVETLLRGGSYDLFHDPRNCPEGIGRRRADGTFVPHVLPASAYAATGGNPCQPAADKLASVNLVPWKEEKEESEFDPFFRYMEETGCNFVRVFLGGATIVQAGSPVSISPFVRVGAKFDVRGAVEGSQGGNWNRDYFDRLSAFVHKADTRGVVVQLALFNYRELVPDPAEGPVQAWSVSPWNVKNSLHDAWATAHLIPHLTEPGARQRQFVAPPGDRQTRTVQRALIQRVMEALAGLGNVVLEVMNEPHGIRIRNAAADLARVAEFNSFVAGAVSELRPQTGLDARVSVNASFAPTEDGAPPEGSDMDLWRARPDLEHYDQVDLVSYHQLTMRGSRHFGACGGVWVPGLDATSIRDRVNLHAALNRPGDAKAPLFSTDAVSVRKFEHTYRNEAFAMNVREGQILPAPDGSVEGQFLRSHVFHWAKRCFARRVHFHNDATYRLALLRIGQAAGAAGLQPPVPGDPAEMLDPV